MHRWRFFIAFLFFIEQNNYFGWHALPPSDAELIVDGITMLLLSLSVRTKRHAS